MNKTTKIGNREVELTAQNIARIDRCIAETDRVIKIFQERLESYIMLQSAEYIKSYSDKLIASIKHRDMLLEALR